MRTRSYTSLAQAEQAESELLKQRCIEQGTIKEVSYLYQDKRSGHVIAKDEHCGKMITRRGEGVDGNFDLVKGVAVESV